MRIKMKRIIVLSLFVFVNGLLLGQGVDVVLEARGNREVEPAARITEIPVTIDTVVTTKVMEYPLLVVQQPTSIQLDTIKATTISLKPKNNPLYRTFLKLGVSSELMPLGELFFDSKRDRRLLYGLHAKHLSSYGYFDRYAPAQFDRTNVSGYGKFVESKYTLDANAHYQTNGFHYYGFEADPDTIDAKSIAQRYQDMGGTFKFSSHVKDSSRLNYSISSTFANFTTLKPQTDSLSDWRGVEDYFNVLASAKYKKGNDLFMLDMGLNYDKLSYGKRWDTLSTINDTGFVRKNAIFNIKPTILTTSYDNRFSAKVGLDFVVDAGYTNRVYLYPVAEVKYALIDNWFIPYLGVQGGLKQTTFRGLTQTNEFLIPNVSLKNENNLVQLYGGIKGSFSRRVSYHVSGEFSRTRDKLFFVTDTLFSAQRNKFNLIYDTLTKIGIEASVSYQQNEKLKLDVIGRYNFYEALNNTYAWNLPQWVAIGRASYNLYDKFMAHVDLTFEGGRFAQVYSPGDGVEFKNDQYYKSLGLVADVNLGLEYRYNKRISAFIQCNNLASQRYMRWYGYPVQIFQLAGGLTFKF